MRHLLPLLLCFALSAVAAEKKKPAIKTTTKVQVGTPKTSSSRTSFGGFSALDRNGDGSISRSEYMYNKDAGRNADFDKLDANKDGKLSRSEYR